MGKIDLIYPELSYKLVGSAFKIFNDLGYGFPEKHYQQAFGELLKQQGFAFKREYFVQLEYLGEKIGKYFLDFVVDEKIVIELKVKSKMGYVHIKQVVCYLRSTGYKLAILIHLTRDGVKYRRIVNLPPQD